MPVDIGAAALAAINWGPTPIQRIYQGSTLLWSPPVQVGEVFTQLGILENWIIDTLGNILPGLGGALVPIVFDGIYSLVTGVADVVGLISVFVPGLSGIQAQLFGSAGAAGTNLGAMIAQVPSIIQTDIQGLLDNLTIGITGFLNGIPILGGIITDIESILTGATPINGITSLLGAVGVAPSLAQQIGAIADPVTGALADPINIITDLAGNVVGHLTNATFTPLVGAPSGVAFPIGVVGNMALPLMPQGLVAMATQSSYARYNGTTAGDDGWVQTALATVGAPGLITQVFRRWDNTGAAASGVGMDFRSSVASIVRRVGGVDTLVAPALASYTPGDTFRLVQAGDAHIMVKNGLPIGQWVDNTATALVGSANRSIAMAQQFGQQRLGPSQFSAALSYVIGN